MHRLTPTLAATLCLLLTSVATAQPPGGRGAFRMPRPGPCPLPVLPALSELSDTAFYAETDVPHGKVKQTTYTNHAGREKRMHVYLPPGYEQDDATQFPVLYLNHGGFDDDSAWTSTDRRQGGHAHFILDNLIAAGNARPMIVAMPDTRGIVNFAPSRPGEDDACTQEYLQDIIPHVESRYRARPGREHRALAGLSMGGIVVLNTGLAHLDTFSELYVYSSGYFGGEQQQAFEDNFKPVLEDRLTNNRFRVPFYMAAGETDLALRNSQRTLAAFNRNGIRNFWVLSSGGHDWANWRRYLHQSAQIMFPDCPSDAGGDPPLAAAPPEGFDVPREGIERGKVERVEYDSKTVGVARPAIVYTPPGYSSDRKYPVLYLLHGIGDDETGWTTEGAAGAILDNRLADGKMVPMIVVTPNGRASTDSRAGGDFRRQIPAFERFEDDLLKDLIPFIESRYSVRADRDHRALAGLSIGGGQSLNFGLTHLDTFAWIGAFSSAPTAKPAAELIADSEQVRRDLRLLWLSCGDEDFLLDISRSFHQALTTMQIPHDWRITAGGHDWDVWKTDLHAFAQRIFVEQAP